jgi:hypothetical protein
MSSIRARAEHLFRVIKCQFGYTKVRYNGTRKNAAQVFSLIGLSNLYLARRKRMIRREKPVRCASQRGNKGPNDLEARRESEKSTREISKNRRFAYE